MEKKFGELLKQIRSEMGLNQESFAKEIGVSVNALKGYESDKFIPTAAKIGKISAVTGYDFDALFALAQAQRVCIKNKE